MAKYRIVTPDQFKQGYAILWRGLIFKRSYTEVKQLGDGTFVVNEPNSESPMEKEIDMPDELKDLTPAPWEVKEDDLGIFLLAPDGFAMLVPAGISDINLSALRFAARARNVLDIQMRRGWG